MKTTEVFSSKAEKYARYRWDYAPQAIQTIFDRAQLSNQSVVADIGAGTGILTRHFVDRVKRVFAIEPNVSMRQMAIKALGAIPTCQIVDGCAEATTLDDHSVDLIAVATAIGWFDPQPAKREFLRILKPGGWLAVLHNYSTDQELDAALEHVFPPESDKTVFEKGRGTPLSFYYGSDSVPKQSFAFTTQRTWEQFIGSLLSASFVPDETSPLYPDFERAAKEVFDRFSSGGVVVSPAATELCLGQIVPSSQ
ncbi:MAG: class I SAM-dependent methyltransferase [Anaerolineae bacterium]|nr:class I SAM-dependent methyltransferase [Anaerolineae bacterium]